MQWFYNMTIGKKLMLSFFIMAVIAGAIGYLGITNINTIVTYDAVLYKDMTVPISQLETISTNFQQVQATVRDILLANSPEQVRSGLSKIKGLCGEISTVSAEYEKSIQSEEMKTTYNEFVESRTAYGEQLDRFISLMQGNNRPEALVLLQGEMDNTSAKELTSIEKMTEIKVNDARRQSDLNASVANYADRMMLIVLVIGFMAALLLGMFISRIIGNPIRALSGAVGKLARGDVNVKVEANSMDEIGDLSRDFEKMVTVFKDLVNETHVLTKAAGEGKLDTRGDADRFEGSFREIVVSINNTLDAVIGPLNVAAEYVDRIAKGDIPPKISETYKGDFNEIKNNLNDCIDAVNLLVTDANILAKAAVDGKLDTRADASKHQGDFGKIVTGVNETLDAVIGPLNVAAEYVDRISRGDIPPKVTDAYKGDFNEIKNNLNQCIDGLGGLIEANAVLQKMAVNDYTTAVNGKYQGVFADVAKATNDVRDRVMHVIQSVRNVADGDLKDLESYKQIGDGKGRRSDNDVVVPAVIHLIENIKALTDDVQKLSAATVEGQLDVRADASRHQGDFRKIIEGMNELMESVALPLNLINEALHKISVYDLTRSDAAAKIEFKGIWNDSASSLRTVMNRFETIIRVVNNISMGNLQDIESLRKIGRRSEADELVPAFVRMIESILALVSDTRALADAGVKGQLDVRADVSKHQGEFRTVIQGVNNILDAIIGPLNVAAEYIDRISKGDIPPKVTDAYNGDFNEIKNNLNACIEGLEGLVEANAVLQRMAINDYTVGVNGQYQGVFAEVARAANDVQTRIKLVIAVTKRISNGDLSDLVNLKQVGNGKGRRSENDDLTPSFIRLMENLKGTIADIDMLANNALQGKLDTRADALKHEGDFRKIVEGVNDTLDALVAPVNETVGCIERMAVGDLTVQVTGDYKGDLAKMKNALNTTVNALNDILGQVNTAADQVVSGANQVSDAAQSLSQGATEQASSLEEITASMTEMNSQTKQNAENAQQANKLAAAARDNAQTGNDRMREMLGAMKEINDSSGQISRIIKVIDEIAFQTNLLALNAAVEAARAGVHGKGFAVVADEVRNLAQRSAKAAKETTELIENSIKKVENGTGIANETAKALNEIVSGVTKVTDLVGEIASASNEQAQGIAQVNQGLGQVDQVTQANTANAEESAAASEELSGQATNLQHMITRFQLTNRIGTGKGEYEKKGSGSHGRNIVKNESMAGHDGRRLASQKAAMSEKTTFLTPVDHIAPDDDEFGKY